MIPVHAQSMPAADLKQLLGTTVKSRRFELGISQEELADRAGLHRTYVSDVERGARNLSLESIEKLAGALQLPVAELFEQSGAAPVAAPTLEILLVEDMLRDIELTLRAFRKANFSNPIHVVRDGAEAIDFLLANGDYTWRRDAGLPDVVLLDLNLPKISGIEVLQKIKAHPKLRAIPVIVLTSSQEDCDAVACRALGAQTYIVKPVDFLNFSEAASLLHLGWQLIKPPGQ